MECSERGRNKGQGIHARESSVSLKWSPDSPAKTQAVLVDRDLTRQGGSKKL